MNKMFALLKFFPHCPGEGPHARVHDVVRDHLGPAGVVLEAVVILGRDRAHLVQPAPRHRGVER